MRAVPLCLMIALAACEPAKGPTTPMCGDDCTGEPDAPPHVQPDAAPDAPPPDDDVVITSLTFAELPADVNAEATADIADAEGTAAGAAVYESQTADVAVSSIAPDSENRDGRVAYLLFRWGHLPPTNPGPIGSWTNFDGYLAVSEGAIEVVRAIRWEGTNGPSSPRPHADFVAPRTDSRVVRFRSSIGSGSDGLLVRITRPAIEPTVMVIRLGSFSRAIPLDEHMGNAIVFGGFEVPAGNLEIDADVPLASDACYIDDGIVDGGTLTYTGDTIIDQFHGSVARPGGGTDTVAFTGDAHLGPYGNFAGTVGGSTLSGYYGRHFLFGEFENRGVMVGRVNAGDTVVGFFAGRYDGDHVSVRMFHRAACSDTGAMHKNWFAR